MKNINGIIDGVKDILKTHWLDETGGYARWNWQNEAGNRALGKNPYGCADAANILYMIGQFPADSGEREQWVKILQEFQTTDTGLFHEETHHPYHTTAHCIAALELFEAKARFPLKCMHQYLEKNKLEQFLEELHWADDPWIASHQGAGIYAALVLMEEADMDWENWYFDWLYRQQDEKTGFWRSNMVQPILKGDSFAGARTTPSVFPHLAASFHYLFNHEYAHRPLHYPEQMIDSCLYIYRSEEWETLGKNITFAEVDWVYCLNRALRQCHYKFDEATTALHDFAEMYIDYIDSLNYRTHEGFNDMHTLFGCICALAELQSALPGEIVTQKPLKLVLDRRPFI